MAMEITIDGDNTVLVLSGEIDVKSTPDLKKILNEVDTTRNLVVVGSDLTYIDSSGVACLLMAYKKFAAAPTEVILQNPSDALTSVLKILKFDTLFKIEN
ncbi:STAS domain-containing protein [Alphaproteobacteria bacterium]|nr:STAS domain-containing protein [Alphaproteobacteria bacterium]